MRIKKGFTLAEILIVLMVIGVIATMTVPSMMKGVNDAQLKTAYKKAFNTIANWSAMEKIAGTLPAIASGAAVADVYKSLDSSLSVKEYATQAAGAGTIAAASQFGTSMTLPSGTAGATMTLGNGTSICTVPANGTGSQCWIVTEDNMAYQVHVGNSQSPANVKNLLMTKENLADIISISTSYIIVDVNGLGKGPNTLEAQAEQQTPGTVAESKAMNSLVGDQYYIFLASDGATAGNKKFFVTGRIVGDMK